MPDYNGGSGGTCPRPTTLAGPPKLVCRRLLDDLLAATLVHLVQQAVELFSDMQPAASRQVARVVEDLHCSATASVTAGAGVGWLSFSVLKRVKNYLRSTIGQQRMTDLSLLCIEPGLLDSLDTDMQ